MLGKLPLLQPGSDEQTCRVEYLSTSVRHAMEIAKPCSESRNRFHCLGHTYGHFEIQ